MAALFVVLGLVALVLGADLAVGGAQRLGRRVGISDLVIGLTITSIGTSLPELATTLTAAVTAQGPGSEEAAGVGLGNILGSNLFLLLGLMGLTGVVRTLHIDHRSLYRDGVALGVATALSAGAMLSGQLGRVEGVLLAVAYVVYLVVLLRTEPRDAVPSAEEDGFFLDSLGVPEPATDGARVVVGLVVLVLGAGVVVQRGIELAEVLGVNATLVGVLAGIGTSLPEVVVSLRSAAKGSADIAVGNILGSSVVNLLLCLGLSAAVAPIPVPDTVLRLDTPFLVAGTVIALALMTERRDVTRAEGVALLTTFALYLYLRAVYG
ncbi:MAG: sodium:calcium antiporter [Deltaproteobacteria bacterium]|nr:MAG: sodium:calcium antiporter [Deltaproteobacteria bacterium]